MTRSAPQILKEQMDATAAGRISKGLHGYYEMAQAACACWKKQRGYIHTFFGELMHEGWAEQRQFSGSISIPTSTICTNKAAARAPMA